MLEFSYRPKVFYGFRRDEGRSDETLIERDRVVDLVLLNSDLRKQQSRGDMKKKKHTRGMKLKVFPFELTQFLVNSLFYT